jgi:hypothetical protein
MGKHKIKTVIMIKYLTKNMQMTLIKLNTRWINLDLWRMIYSKQNSKIKRMVLKLTTN